MSKDDMRRVAYSCLVYFDECTKRHKKPNREELEKIVGSGVCYLDAVLLDLYKAECFTGAYEYKAEDEHYIIITDSTRLTLDGYDYMKENTIMRRVADSNAGKAIINAVIGAIVK
ncbi:MAG TPA: hypothetical protein DCP49_00630 [Erysipelotrichaceae bacterium]|nr:hypothetical protein [Erysipelotrichaceae bacterium]